jgi:MFS family permease
MGFMFLEVTLIQRLTLFLGYPTYSLTVTLFALLVSTGIGSFVAERGGARRGALLRRLAVLALLVPFYAFGLPPLLAPAIGWPLALRAAVAAACLAPLGVCLGGFMPIGLGAVAGLTPRREEFVAWSWAVNGFFSVVSSVLATILAMSLGFSVVMLTALAVYGVGVSALLRIPEAASPKSSS